MSLFLICRRCRWNKRIYNTKYRLSGRACRLLYIEIKINKLYFLLVDGVDETNVFTMQSIGFHVEPVDYCTVHGDKNHSIKHLNCSSKYSNKKELRFKCSIKNLFRIKASDYRLFELNYSRNMFGLV